jgi:hypothetical protein
MKISINQPAYLPWLGYFDRIYQSDLHVVLDHVQFEKNSFVNRNKIVSNQIAQMLTVPLQTKGKFGDLAINNVTIADNNRWHVKHYRAIEQGYSRAQFKETILPKLKKFYDEERGGEFGEMLQRHLNQYLDLLNINKTEILYSSGLSCSGSKSDLILSICMEVNATKYLSGPFGRNYLNVEAFSEAGIDIAYHDYKHPTYTQQSKEFLPHMSVLDLLMNHGSESLKILAGLDGAAQ